METGDDEIYIDKGSRFTQVRQDDGLAVLEGDRTVQVVEGNHDLTAQRRVRVLGKGGISQIGHQLGVTIQGTGDGVSIHSTGKSVDISSEGGGLMDINATTQLTINVGGASGPTVTITPTQVQVDGKGNPVQILGSKIKLNT